MTTELSIYEAAQVAAKIFFIDESESFSKGEFIEKVNETLQAAYGISIRKYRAIAEEIMSVTKMETI